MWLIAIFVSIPLAVFMVVTSATRKRGRLKIILVGIVCSAIAYGLLFGTFITLLLIPCLYAMGRDIRRIARMLNGLIMSIFTGNNTEPLTWREWEQ